MTEIIHGEDKEVFIKTLNQRGFVLEDRAWKIISKMLPARYCARNKVVDYSGERIEIDFVFLAGNKHCVVDCKRTAYTWIFAKAGERPDTISLIYDLPNKGVFVRTRATSDFKTAWSDIAMMIKSDGRLEVRSNEVRTSYRDIHENVRQVLKETEAFLSIDKFSNTMIVPTIITNAKLYSLEYKEDNIDENGDIKDFENLQQVGFIAYNFPEIMRWDNKQKLVVNAGNAVSPDHTKTVFIVNINHFESFVHIMLAQD